LFLLSQISSGSQHDEITVLLAGLIFRQQYFDDRYSSRYIPQIVNFDRLAIQMMIQTLVGLQSTLENIAGEYNFNI